MTDVSQIIATLERLRTDPKDSCVITSEDGQNESQLLGTRDGYLNLAIVLLQLVEAVDSPASSSVSMGRDESKRSSWSNHIKRGIADLPCVHPFLVNAEVFDDRAALIEHLSALVDPQLPKGIKLTNDPDWEIDRPVETWAVVRQDDNGNRFVVNDHLSESEAIRIVAEFESRGHKQTYWIERSK